MPEVKADVVTNVPLIIYDNLTLKDYDGKEGP